MDFTTLRTFFEEYEKKNTGKHLTAYIRLSNRDFPGTIQYDERSRTYIISSEAALFQQGKGPELYGMPLDVIVGLGTNIHGSINSVSSFVMLCVAPLNLVKGAVVSVLTMLLYKHVARPLFGREK